MLISGNLLGQLLCGDNSHSSHPILIHGNHRSINDGIDQGLNSSFGFIFRLKFFL